MNELHQAVDYFTTAYRTLFDLLEAYPADRPNTSSIISVDDWSSFNCATILTLSM
jgi:hypothetical protein